MSNVTALDDLNDVGLPLHQKMDFWATYTSFNGLGSIICTILIISVARLGQKNSSDVLSASLCFSCLVMSVSCGMQCLLNLINREFAYGHTACYTEALFHLISIITMFLILFLMAYNSHRTVVKGESLSVKRTMVLVFLSWVFSAMGSGLFSMISPIYMSPSGTFCFFTFDSAFMYAFFLPCFVISACAMIFYYYKIFKITSEALKTMKTTFDLSEKRKKNQMKLAQKLFSFVVVFLVGWVVLVVGILLQLVRGDMSHLDAIGGILGTMHSLAVPIVYGLINPRLRTGMLSMMTCGWYRNDDIMLLGNDSSSSPGWKPSPSTTTKRIEIRIDVSPKQVLTTMLEMPLEKEPELNLSAGDV